VSHSLDMFFALFALLGHMSRLCPPYSQDSLSISIFSARCSLPKDDLHDLLHLLLGTTIEINPRPKLLKVKLKLLLYLRTIHENREHEVRSLHILRISDGAVSVTKITQRQI
jgi:hypothetical protein